METIVFIIYTISLLSAAVCLWVKWDQDEDKHRMRALERRLQELEEQLGSLEKQIKKVGSKDPFSK